MDQKPWYQTFYGEDHLRIFAPILSDQRSNAEVEAIEKLLQLPPGGSILDLCCGHGRHSIPLAAQGYQVTGLDLSDAFIKQAREDAHKKDVHVRWLQQDMRDIPFENEFDAIINISTAFGYLEDEEEDQKVLRQVHKSLKPGGIFLQEIINRDAVLRRYLPSSVTCCTDGTLLVDERAFDLRTSRSNGKQTIFFPNGRRAAYTESVRLYTLTELLQKFAAANLHVTACDKDLGGQALSLDTFRMVIIGTK